MTTGRRKRVACAFFLGLVVIGFHTGFNQVPEEVPNFTIFEIPFHGSGRLITTWNGASGDSRSNKLVLTLRGKSQEVPVDAPWRARWLTSEEIIVEVWPPRKDSNGMRILKINPRGTVLEILSDGEGLGRAYPSQDRRWIALSHIEENGNDVLSIYSMEDGFSLHQVHSETANPGTMEIYPGVFGVAWSPDATQIAIAQLTRRRGMDRHLPHLYLLSREQPSLTPLSEGNEVEPGGVVPLFWNEEGIYARSSRGLLACDPNGKGCTLVYSPGKMRFTFGGTSVGEDKALLLVQDHKADRFEARAREIHEVDLTTGEGRVLLRLPEGHFITDIDWIEEPGY